jgi:alpha-mannosidase
VTETPILYQGIHPGTRKESDTFLSVTGAPDVVIEAVKQAEDGNDVIVRSYETAGHETTATLKLDFAGMQWTGRYHPFEIKTLRVNKRLHRVREVNALEE